MYAEFLTLKLCLTIAIIAAIFVLLKMIFFPHKYKEVPMTFDLRAVKKPEAKRIAEVPRAPVAPAAPAAPAFRKCKVHPPKRGR